MEKEIRTGDKVLYHSEVFYFRGWTDDGQRALLSQNIDGKPTLCVRATVEYRAGLFITR